MRTQGQEGRADPQGEQERNRLMEGGLDSSGVKRGSGGVSEEFLGRRESVAQALLGS